MSVDRRPGVGQRGFPGMEHDRLWSRQADRGGDPLDSADGCRSCAGTGTDLRADPPGRARRAVVRAGRRDRRPGGASVSGVGGRRLRARHGHAAGSHHRPPGAGTAPRLRPLAGARCQGRRLHPPGPPPRAVHDDQRQDRRGRRALRHRAPAGQDALQAVRHPPRVRVPGLRGGLPVGRLPPDRGRPARWQRRPRFGVRAPGVVPDADPAVVRDRPHATGSHRPSRHRTPPARTLPPPPRPPDLRPRPARVVRRGARRRGHPASAPRCAWTATTTRRQVVWNAWVPKLWTRTVDAVKRDWHGCPVGTAARRPGSDTPRSPSSKPAARCTCTPWSGSTATTRATRPRSFRRRVGRPPTAEPAPRGRRRARRRSGRPPHPDRSDGWLIQWGEHVRPLTVGRGLSGAEVTEQHVAGYLAKYATKATEPAGHLSVRLTDSTVRLYADPARHVGRLHRRRLGSSADRTPATAGLGSARGRTCSASAATSPPSPAPTRRPSARFGLPARPAMRRANATTATHPAELAATRRRRGLGARHRHLDLRRHRLAHHRRRRTRPRRRGRRPLTTTRRDRPRRPDRPRRDRRQIALCSSSRATGCGPRTTCPRSSACRWRRSTGGATPAPARLRTGLGKHLRYDPA